MSRPEFPIGTVLPANCISRIREEQEAYDKDPEGYERREEERREEIRMEEERLAEYHQQCIEDAQNYQEEEFDEDTEPTISKEDLPF